MESSDTRPIFQQQWTTPKYAEVLVKFRKIAHGVEECGPYPGLRWVSPEDNILHRAKPQDLEAAALEIETIDAKDVGRYAQDLLASFLSSQIMPLEDAEGNTGYWYSAVGMIVIEPGPASYPSIKITPKAMDGLRQAFRTYFEGQGDITCVISPVTLPVGFLKQCGPGLARHILYTADVLQNSEKGITEEHGPRVFARAINGVPPQYPPATDTAELERAGAQREPCLPGHTHVLPFLISLTRMGDASAIKHANRLFRDNKEVADAKSQLLISVATEVFSVNPAVFSQLEIDPDVSFFSGSPLFREPKKT